MTNHLDPAAVLDLLDDLRVDRDAADIFNIPARDRLAVRNDCQRFHHCTRVLGRLFRMQAIEIHAHLRAALQAPARSQRDQLDTAVEPVLAQLLKQHADGVRGNIFVEELAQVIDSQGILRADQRGLEDDLRLLGIHSVERLVIARGRQVAVTLEVCRPAATHAACLNAVARPGPAREGQLDPLGLAPKRSGCARKKGRRSELIRCRSGTTRAISSAAMGTDTAPGGCQRRLASCPNRLSRAAFFVAFALDGVAWRRAWDC